MKHQTPQAQRKRRLPKGKKPLAYFCGARNGTQAAESVPQLSSSEGITTTSSIEKK
jgi:hypothetical protein